MEELKTHREGLRFGNVGLKNIVIIIIIIIDITLLLY